VFFSRHKNLIHRPSLVETDNIGLSMFDALSISETSLLSFARSAQTTAPVDGLTHNVYKYPARFSPLFARSAITTFTKPGDWVIDPFMGGGTTIVESLASGRRVAGIDINDLAHFITKSKTLLLSDAQIECSRRLVHGAVDNRALGHKSQKHASAKRYSVRNLSGQLWRIRNEIAAVKDIINTCADDNVRLISTASLLRAAQRSLDCRMHLPRIHGFRRILLSCIDETLADLAAYRSEVRNAWANREFKAIPKPFLLRMSTADQQFLQHFPPNIKPRLILTSPPYPGVHVLYHRWQILGRHETDAPYWISDCSDGSGASFYTFGDRKNSTLDKYFEGVLDSFLTLRRICTRDTVVVQLMAFSNIAEQLPRYLATMHKAGYSEVRSPVIGNSIDGRLWRTVPHRKWYSSQLETQSRQEVVLIHQPIF